MATLLNRAPATLPRPFYQTTRILARNIQTLDKSPHIYIHPTPTNPSNHLLTLTPTTPPNPHLALGNTTALPPSPESFTENHHFLELLQSVVADHATADPDVQVQAQAYASPGGSGLGSGGANFPGQNRRKRSGGRAVGGGGGAGAGGAGGASAQGGMGGGGVGGFIHVSDQRNPPDWGRIPWPEDILGSLEVDGEGRFVGNDGKGGYQRSGTYRVVTRDGVLGISPFLRGKLVESVRELEKKV